MLDSRSKRGRFRLNERLIRDLVPPPKGNRLYYDDTIIGFALRVTAAGTRSFVLNYHTQDGKERRVTIGRWPVWTTTAARERAKKLKREVDVGGDPIGARESRKQLPTFEEVAEEYMERYASKKRTGDRDREYLKRDVLPRWGERKAEEITKREVIDLIEEKAVRAPVAANRLLSVLRKLFNWSIERDILKINPCNQVKPPTKERSRERVLTGSEIKRFWSGLDETDMGPELRTALRLTLATAQRPGEVISMAWADVDMALGWWIIPGERAKNGLAHRVPLNDTAIRLLQSLEGLSERWVFPSPRKDAPIVVNAVSHALGRNQEIIGIAKFTARDLRRTAASHMASEGVPRFTLARVLNHVEPGVTRVYDRYSYDKEKRQALEEWDRILTRILDSDTNR